MSKILVRLVVVIALLPLAACALYKPSRVLAPSWVDGVSCIDTTLCLEETSRYPQAIALYADALSAVAKEVGPFKQQPRITFCSTQSCFHAFGFDQAKAVTLSSSGIVIGPSGWHPHYLRHELIHHRQAEELGRFSALSKPEWLIEGMAYTLSNDPRDKLTERWQNSIERFEKWFEKVGRENMWAEARRL